MSKDRAGYSHTYYEANKEKLAAQSAGQDAMPRPPKNIYRTLCGTYKVIIVRDCHRYYAGTHKTIDEAVTARNAKLKELEEQKGGSA